MKSIIARIFLILLFPLSIFINGYFREDPSKVEKIATGSLFKTISTQINKWISATNQSIAEYVIPIFFGLLLVYLIVTIILVIKKKEKRGKRLFNLIFNFAAIAGFVYFLFTLTCGIMYYRPTFAETNGIELCEYSTEDLRDMTAALAKDLNVAKVAVKTDSNGVTVMSFKTMEDALNATTVCYEPLTREYKCINKGFAAPKKVSFLGLMPYTNITGFFFPFIFEANVCTDIPYCSLPATMCHEMAHISGYMKEDEANFIAYLACKRSGSADFRYSGLLLAYTYAANALYRANPEYYIEVFGTLSDGVKKDISYRDDYWNKYKGFIANISDAVNNVYLKTNDQTDGTESYGRMVDLLMAEYKSGKSY